MKLNTYEFLIDNEIVHVKIDEKFREKMKEKVIQKFGSLRQYNFKKLQICYGTLTAQFKRNRYFKFIRLLEIANDIKIPKEETFSHIKSFFASGSNTCREVILPKELIIDEGFVEGYALYLAEGDSGFNGNTIPRKLRLTNSDLEIIRFFIQWLRNYFPKNRFYLNIILPPGIGMQESFIRQTCEKLSLSIDQIRIRNGYYNKKPKYRVCCDRAILIDLILSLEKTIKKICAMDKELAAAYTRGMMMGEGTAYFNRSRYVRIEMRNEKEIKYLANLFELLGYKYKVALRSNRENMWSIYLGAKQLKRFYNEVGFGFHRERQEILERAVNKKLRINQYV